MPGSGVTPELVALMPSGYTPRTWDMAGKASMQMAANKRRRKARGLERFRVTSRAKFDRLRVDPKAEVSKRCYSGCLPTETACPHSSRMASARAVRRLQPQQPSRQLLDR